MSEIEFFLDTDQDDDRPVFLSGTFNQWCEADPAFQMKRIGKAKFYFKLKTDHRHPLYYRYHKGDWNQEELDAWGNVPDKRKIPKSVNEIRDTVARWRMNGLAASTQYMPQKIYP